MRLSSSTTRHRQLVRLPWSSRSRSRTSTLELVAWSGGAVVIDGLVVARRG